MAQDTLTVRQLWILHVVNEQALLCILYSAVKSEQHFPSHHFRMVH